MSVNRWSNPVITSETVLDKISTITLSIHQLLDLKEVFSLAVQAVQELLQTNYVLIYRATDLEKLTVQAVAREGENGRPLLRQMATWLQITGLARYGQGEIIEIADCQASQLELWEQKLLADAQVQAVLGVPIFAQADLWGVILACHCFEPRSWQSLECKFLQQVAVQLGIGIQQTALRQQSEERLRQSQQKYQTLVNSVQGIVWEADPQTFQFTFVSAQAEVILGYAPERWLEPNFWLEHLHPDDRLWAPEFCSTATEAQQDHDLEYRMIAADGRVVWLYDKVYVVVEAGQVVRLIGLMIETTEQKQAKLLLQEREQVYRALVENSPDIIERFDTQLRHLYVSPVLTQITGIPAEVFLGKTCRDLGMAEPMLNAWEEAAGRLLATGEKQLIEFETPTLQGLRCFEMAIAPELTHDQMIESILCVSRDVTERKLAETNLRHYERIVSATPDCVALIDRNYRYQAINQTYVIWNGKPASAIIGHSVEELLGEELFQAVKPLLDRCLAGATENWDGWFTYPGVGLKFVRAVYVPCTEPDGAISGVLINVHDVTDLKQVEEALLQSEERFRQMANSIHEVFWMADYDMTQILYVSPAYEEIWGRSCASLYENPASFLDPVHPDDRNQVLHTLKHQRQQGFSHEYRLIHPDGSTRWIWERASLVQTPAGQPYRLVGISQDITARKAVEDALRVSEEQRRLALELTQVGSWDWQLRTGELVWSEQTYSLMGFVPGDPEYVNWRERLWPEDLGLLEAAIAESQVKKTYFNCEYRVVRPDGSVRWILTRGQTLYNPGGEPVRMIGIVMDISDRKQAELSLQHQSQREQSLNRVFQAIRDSLDLDQIFATATMETATLIQVERVQIALHLPDLDCWRITASYQPPGFPDTVGVEIPVTANPISQQLKLGETVLVQDTNQLSDVANQKIAQVMPGAWLLAPIKIQEVVWGCLVANCVQHTFTWSHEQITLVQAVADQLAIAIQQANLYMQTQQELIERQRAEVALQKLNQDLEQRVQQRTQALQQQAEQERLLRLVTQRIHQSFDLEEILATALMAARQTIQADRVAIYRFNPDWSGNFIAESVSADWIPLVGSDIQKVWEDTYLQETRGGRYRHNQTYAVHDIYSAGHRQCHIDLLEQFQARAYAIAPIFVHDSLWGLLAAYQNSAPRQWRRQEVDLLKQIGIQMAIAIQQSQLYQTAQNQVRELERLNQIKDDFLSTVSHELRSPMTNIKMATQMLEIQLSRAGVLDSLNNTPINRYFEILKEQSLREIQLINDLLDLARLDASSDPLVLTRIPLASWIDQLAQAFLERIRLQQQQLQLHIAPGLELETDVSSLERILTELLHNACKYTPAGETIQIAAHQMDETSPGSTFLLAGETIRPRLQISVSNSGIEIPPEECDRIFDKFYRIPKHDPWKHGGTGLGLALVKKLAERLGGSIRVESYHRLTSFILEL